MAGQEPTVDTGAAPTTAQVGAVVMPQADTQLTVVPPANPEVSGETARQMLGKSREPSAEELAAEATPATQSQFVPLEAAEQVLQKRMARTEKKLREEQEAAISPLRDALAQVQAGVERLLQDREEAAPPEEPEAPEPVPPVAATPTPATNRELQKWMQRAKDAEDKAAAQEARAKAADQARLKSERDALVARMAAEKGLNWPPEFLAMVQGKDEDEIGDSFDLLVEAGRKTFAPKSTGSAAQPPAAPAAATPPTPEQVVQNDEEMINAATDPSNPLHAQAKQWLRTKHGKRMVTV